MKTWIGTSGFQYPEWKGKFYPEDLPAAGMLGYYAGQFATTEINYSFRRIPGEATLLKWHAATPKEFRFAFKAPQKITHFARLRNCEEVARAFFHALDTAGDKLGPVLFQLPPTFRKDTGALKDFLAAIPKEKRTAFEFRHPSWFEDSVLSLLKEHDAALCIAESEDLATPKVRTADFGYFRLRREDYTNSRLSAWAEFVGAPGVRENFVYFKHEDRALGPKFAGSFALALSKLRSG